MAYITNPYGNGTDKSNVLVDCNASGIRHTTRMDHSAGEFSATMLIPWPLINGDASVDSSSASSSRSLVNAATGSTSTAQAGDVFMGNFFRVVMAQNVSDCDPTTCAYGAWSPTFRTPPAFHVSTDFGEMRLVS